jgi:hypothetical protein
MIRSDMCDAATHQPHQAADAEQTVPWGRALLDRQLFIVGELVEGGFEIAQAIRRQASDETAPKVVQGDLAAAYACVSKAVRLSLMLQTDLIQNLARMSHVVTNPAFSREDNIEASRPRLEAQRNARVHRVVSRIARADKPDAEAAERLVREAGERLERGDAFAHVLSLPFSEIIALICKDLGLEPDWPALAEEAWARAEIASGAPQPAPRRGDGHARFAWNPGRAPSGAHGRALAPGTIPRCSRSNRVAIGGVGWRGAPWD